SHVYHDSNGYLPFNGTTALAANGTATSGSWAYQILPYVEQQSVYDSQQGATAVPTSWPGPVSTFLCAIRGRPGYFDSSIVPTGSVVITGTTIVLVADVPQMFTIPAGSPPIQSNVIGGSVQIRGPGFTFLVPPGYVGPGPPVSVDTPVTIRIDSVPDAG